MFLRRVPVASTRPTLCFPARTLRTLTRSATFDLAFLALNRPFRRERQSTEQRGNCRIRHDGPGRAAANNYAVSDARELGIQAAGRAMLPDTILPRREEFVAVPMLNLEICDDLRAHAVNRNVPALAELLPPIFEGLLVDVVFSALTGDCGREHHKRPVRRQSIDKFGGMGSRQMLGDLEALHHVKAPPEVDGPTKVRGAKLICIDHQMFSVDVRAVDTHLSCAGLPPYVQPSAVAASEIDNAADLQRGAQQRNDLLRRTDRKGRQETVEIFGVFVQMFLPDIRQIPGDFAPRIASSTGLGNDKSPSPQAKGDRSGRLTDRSAEPRCFVRTETCLSPARASCWHDERRVGCTEQIRGSGMPRCKQIGAFGVGVPSTAASIALCLRRRRFAVAQHRQRGDRAFATAEHLANVG